jgi:hypothetical protein
MVLRGEQIQRCGLGGCTHLTSHTLFKQIAKLYPTCAFTPALSGPGKRVYVSSPDPHFMSPDRDIARHADFGHQ